MFRKSVFCIFVSFIQFTTIYASNLLAINFQQKDDLSYLDLLFDNENVEVVKNHVIQDKQIILDVKGVDASERVMRAFDTSEFSGAVVFVSAYKRPSSPEDVRIVLQLRENVRSKVKTEGQRTILTLENRFGVLGRDKIGNEDELANTVINKKSTRINVPKSESIEDILENLTLSGRKKYIGKKITLNVKQLAVSNVLEMIADASGFNIIQPSDVGSLPPLTMNLVNTPWDQVLDTVMELNDLVAQKNGSILIIKTLAQAVKEAEDKANADKKRLEAEPILTKIFPISYANAETLNTILGSYVSERGAIQIDQRTNSLILKETQSAIDKVEKILKFLDTQTPQVLIESKFVEIFEEHAKNIGLNQGLTFGYDPVSSRDSLTNQAAPAAGGGTGGGAAGGGDLGGFSFSTAPSAGEGARDFFGISIGTYGRLLNLNFTLQLLESESKAKIVASPRIVTKHKVPATLSSTDERYFPTTTFTNTASTGGFDSNTAQLSIKVTPQVTNDGSIDLTLDLIKEQFTNQIAANAPFNKTNRDIKTNVLVDNGSTIVIGGLFTYAKRESHSGVPFLKDLPLVGWLFRTPYNPSIEKSELVVFITPRIINQEEAGLSAN